MLQDRAKITLEFDVEGAKKQLSDVKGELDNTTTLTKHKIEKTKEDIKEEERKEINRQQESLLSRLQQMGRRVLSPDFPAQFMSGVIGGVAGLIEPRAGPPVLAAVGTFWRNAENIKLLQVFVDEVLKKTGVPGMEIMGKAWNLTTALLPTETVTKAQKLYEAFTQTTEESIKAYAGATLAGQEPSMNVTGKFVSRLFEYNYAMAMLNVNRRFLQNKTLGYNLIDALTKALRGRQ